MHQIGTPNHVSAPYTSEVASVCAKLIENGAKALGISDRLTYDTTSDAGNCAGFRLAWAHTPDLFAFLAFEASHEDGEYFSLYQPVLLKGDTSVGEQALLFDLSEEATHSFNSLREGAKALLVALLDATIDYPMMEGDAEPDEPQGHAERLAGQPVADPNNDEFQCDLCERIYDNDDSVRVGEYLICERCHDDQFGTAPTKLKQDQIEALGFKSIEEHNAHQIWLKKQAKNRPLISAAVAESETTGIIDVRHIDF